MSQTLLQLPHSLTILPDELWWGGRSGDGARMPFSASTSHRVELNGDLEGNQGAPFLVSSHGRYLWSPGPFSYEIANGEIALTGSMSPVLLSEGHDSLAGAFREAVRLHFPPSGQIPPEEFFSVPQYNTWIELTHFQSQEGVLSYARGIVDNGFPPGVLMIDAGWGEYWGSFRFHAGRFPDPGGMVRELKKLGFRVMLWVCPFVSPDSPEFRRWRDQPGWLLRDREGKPAILKWWDGHSAHLDLTHPPAMEWLRKELNGLQEAFGIDGFKFDAGDVAHYKNRPASWLDAQPVELTEVWAKLGLDFPFNEYRACWKSAGQPLVQRQNDRSPVWERNGLSSLIPNGIAQGLLGHPFICPDMVGGGQYLYFIDPRFEIDEELFVRSAQASALFPMMQFSCAPWRVLSPDNQDLCRAAALLHGSLAPVFIDLARQAARTGEPILRPLEYDFPHQGYASVIDQFLLGSDILVAPVLKPKASSRHVLIPPGRWRDDRGVVSTGPLSVEVETPLDRLPWWRREG